MHKSLSLNALAWPNSIFNSFVHVPGLHSSIKMCLLSFSRSSNKCLGVIKVDSLCHSLRTHLVCNKNKHVKISLKCIRSTFSLVSIKIVYLILTCETKQRRNAFRKQISKKNSNRQMVTEQQKIDNNFRTTVNNGLYFMDNNDVISAHYP